MVDSYHFQFHADSLAKVRKENAHKLEYNTVMFSILAALVGMAILLFVAEVLWHRKVIGGEYARKFVHILGGSFVAFWPFFLSFHVIEIIAAGSVLMWLLTRTMHISYALRDINRPTIGELLYPVSVLLVAMIASDRWIFTVSILFLAVADGMAAVIGRKYATKKMSYEVYGGKKSLQGSLAYLICAYIALAVGMLIGGRTAILHTPFLTLGTLPLLTVFAENISPFGTDNLTIPLIVVFVLNFAVTLALL